MVWRHSCGSTNSNVGLHQLMDALSEVGILILHYSNRSTGQAGFATHVSEAYDRWPPLGGQWKCNAYPAGSTPMKVKRGSRGGTRSEAGKVAVKTNGKRWPDGWMDGRTGKRKPRHDCWWNKVFFSWKWNRFRPFLGSWVFELGHKNRCWFSDGKWSFRSNIIVENYISLSRGFVQWFIQQYFHDFNV